MCGIVGLVSRDPDRENQVQSQIERGTSAVSHRGPDNQQVVTLSTANSAIGLGHARLSVFDLSEKAHQPMRDSHGRTLVFNGEIFNWRSLRVQLEQLGYCFQTRSDTEVVLAAYDHWGTDCVEHFNGMWALALYDPGADGQPPRLFISRDRLGIKPFYYHPSDRQFLFGSEVKAILAMTGEAPRMQPELLVEAFVLKRTDGQAATCYEGVKELRGGQSMLVDCETLVLKEWTYWRLPERDEAFQQLSIEQLLDRFEEVFEDAVKLHLQADIPVALTLSGGIDSSAIALAASRNKSEICAYTSAFSDYPEIDETSYAKRLCGKLGIESRLIEPNLESMLEDVPRELYHQELPPFTLSSYVHHSILKSVRADGTSVVICGQGGDELFLGYDPYLISYLMGAWKSPKEWWKRYRWIVQRSSMGRASLLMFLCYFQLPELRLLKLRRDARRWISPDLLKRLTTKLERMPWDFQALQQQEIKGGQLSRQLRIDDRTSAGLGMELRVPFLDYRVVEFACKLPDHAKIYQGWTKYIIRKYLERYGVGDIAWRTHKLGFDAPTEDWTKRLLASRKEQLANGALAEWLAPKACLEDLPFPGYCMLEMVQLFDWRQG